MSGGDWKNLYKGVEEGDFDLVEFHVKNGVNVNYQHPEILMLPLVVAIKGGHDKIADLLIESGADPLLESYYDQMNALEAAYFFKNQPLILKLKSKGYELGPFKRLKFFLKRSGILK